MTSTLIGRMVTNGGQRGEVAAVDVVNGRFALLVLVDGDLREWNPLYVKVEPILEPREPTLRLP